VTAADAVLRYMSAPKTFSVLAALGITKRSGGMRRAHQLEAYARLHREAVRKILKKYNKKYNKAHGQLSSLPGPPLAFIASRTRTELEHLAAAAAEDAHECPVCLDLIYSPVAPACGHAICRECHDNMCRASTSPQCSVCRRDARQVRKMPMATVAARDANPAQYAERKLSHQRAKDEALANKYAGTIDRLRAQGRY